MILGEAQRRSRWVEGGIPKWTDSPATCSDSLMKDRLKARTGSDREEKRASSRTLLPRSKDLAFFSFRRMPFP